jgi:hypothetical protein
LKYREGQAATHVPDTLRKEPAEQEEHRVEDWQLWQLAGQRGVTATKFSKWPGWGRQREERESKRRKSAAWLQEEQVWPLEQERQSKGQTRQSLEEAALTEREGQVW